MTALSLVSDAGVHHVFFIGYDTTKVAPYYIQQHLISGFFLLLANIWGCTLYPEAPCTEITVNFTGTGASQLFRDACTH